MVVTFTVQTARLITERNSERHKKTQTYADGQFLFETGACGEPLIVTKYITMCAKYTIIT